MFLDKYSNNMGPRTRASLALHTLCVFSTIYIVNCGRPENEDRYFKIPALGRTAHLGHLYNEVLDDFRDVSVFSQAIPKEFIKTAIKPKLTSTFGPVNTFQERCELLNIQETVAANVLAGFTQVDGSASFLNPENFENSAPNEVSRGFIQKLWTVKESLEVFYTNLTALYNSAILDHKTATHVVTGIEWGADTVVTLTSPTRINQTELQAQVKKFSESQLECKESDATFSMSIFSDIPVPFAFSKNLTQVYDLLRHIKEEVKTINDGKGVPTKYVLTPISVIKSFVLPNSVPSNSAHEINERILKEIISRFDQITSTEHQVSNIRERLNSQPNCLLEETKVKMDKLQSAIHDLKSNFPKSLKKALLADRSGSGDGQAVFNISQNYRQNELNANNVKLALIEFKSDLKKTEFCASLAASHPHIEFIGYEQNFDLKISQHFNQSVYVLYTKAEFINNNNIEWQANLYTFINELNQPGNKLYIVDCDFGQAMCVNVSESVIHLYRNGRLASPKVEGFYEEEVVELRSKISKLNSTLLAIISEHAAVFNRLAAMETEMTRNRNCSITHQTGQDTENNPSIQNQTNTGIPEANICEAQKPDFIANATKSASFGCGGTIHLPSKGESIVLDFSLPPTNGSAQRCLWSLDATQNRNWVHFQVNLTLLCSNPTLILDEGTLAFTEWYFYGNSSKGITTNMISSSSQNSFLLSNRIVNRGFLGFHSEKFHTNAGFILRVDVLNTKVSSAISSSSVRHTKSVGSASYSLPHHFDMSSIVINPQPAAKMTLTVDVDSSGYSNPCQDRDSVDIIEFGMDGVARKLGRLCGPESSTSYETENPVAALFLWESGKSGQGVKLSWK